MAKKPFVDDIQSENVTRQMCKNMVVAIIKFGLTKPAILEPALEAVQRMMHNFIYISCFVEGKTFDYDVSQKEIIDAVLSASVVETAEQNAAYVLANAIQKAMKIDTISAADYLHLSEPVIESTNILKQMTIFMTAHTVVIAARKTLSSAVTSAHQNTITKAAATVICAEKSANELFKTVVNEVSNKLYTQLYIACFH